DLPKHHPEGLLGCVEGVRGVAGDPEADVVDPVLVLLVEIPEGSLEPGDRGRLARLDESAIGIVPQRMLLFLMGETDSRTRRFPIRTSPIRFFPPPLTPWMHTPDLRGRAAKARDDKDGMRRVRRPFRCNSGGGGFLKESPADQDDRVDGGVGRAD